MTRTELARRCRLTRSQISRALSGATEVKLPTFFQMIDAINGRHVDLVCRLVDPIRLPSLRESWAELQAAHRAYYDVPFTEAVMSLIQTREYQALASHMPGWIGDRVGIGATEEQAAINALEGAGLIERSGFRWSATRSSFVDTSIDRRAFRTLSGFWAREGANRVTTSSADHALSAYIVFAVGEDELGEIQGIYGEAFERAQRVLQREQPYVRAAMLTISMVPLDGKPIRGSREDHLNRS